MVTQKEDTQSLMAYMGVAFARIDVRSYHIVEFNDAMVNMCGYTREAYDAKFHGEMERYFSGKFARELQKLKDAVKKAQQENTEKFQINLQIPSRQGPLHIYGAGSLRNEEIQGETIPYLTVLYRNVTPLFQAESALEQAQEKEKEQEFLANENRRMQGLLDGVPGGLSTIRIVDGKVVSMRLNKWFQEHVDIEGVQDDELDIQRFTQCLHPDDREICRRNFYAFLQKDSAESYHYRFRKKGTDTYYWGSVRGNLIRQDEHTEVAYFTYTDINEMMVAQDALRESRQLYEHSVDALHLGLWTYDIQNRRIIMGRNTSTMELCRKFGWPAVFENAPESTYDTVMEQDLPAYKKMFEQIQAGRDASCEVWYADASGLEPHCERESYHVVFDEKGQPSFAYGVGQNITADRKVKERYIRELEFLRTNNEENLIAKGHYNLSKNIVLEYENLQHDKASQPVIGDTYDAFIALVYSQAFREEDRKVIQEKLSRTNLIKRYQEGQMQVTMLYQKKFAGDPFWVSLTIHTYMRPETNDLEMFSYAHDVTETKLLEAIMSRVFGNTFDYISIIDARKRTFELIRKARDIQLAEERVKISFDELRKNVIEKHITAEELQRYRNATDLDHIIEMLKRTGQYTTTYLIHKNGKVLCKQIDCLWLDEPNDQILIVRSDVTEAYERDQQYTRSLENAKLEAERANEEKSAFLSGMSHDMRTPLNGILSYTSFALKEKDQEKKQEYLHKVAGSGNLLLDLVDDTLELSRIESGKVQSEPESFELKDLVSTIITSLQPSAQARQIHLDIDLDGETEDLLWGDRKKIQKILLNLLTNSIKYTHPGGSVNLYVQKKVQDAVHGFAFIVEDNGIGMSREFMNRMYEPFSQEKRSESADTPGTGLGLSIVKKYTDLLEGRIEVESKVHVGTKWIVFLPLDKAEERQAMEQKENAAAVSLAGKRVLLCEDNRMNTEIAVMLLKDRGILADTAVNGNEAARKIRSLSRADAKKIPIIAMSADVFEESIRAAKEAGINGYITKPLDPDHMFRELVRYIQ